MQVNHLGPYTLTRMLEPKLIASKARVVNVVSVTHRLEKIRCQAAGAWGPPPLSTAAQSGILIAQQSVHRQPPEQLDQQKYTSMMSGTA